MMGWVIERHRCTLDIAFAEIHDAVERDVAEANTLLSGHRQTAHPFLVENANAGQRFLVKGFPIKRTEPSDEYKFWFTLTEDQILIKRTGTDTLPKLGDVTIKQRWDTRTASCLLVLGGTIIPPDEVSQVVLEPMFFE